jgi:hypothetical protein
MGVAQMAPPLLPVTPGSGFRDGPSNPVGFDSRLRGLIYHIGQIDFRRDSAGVPYFDPTNLSGYTGTSTFTPSQFASVDDETLASISLADYLERGDVANYPGLFSLWTTFGGSGAHPWGELHDQRQHAELVAKLTAAGLTFGQNLYQAGLLANSNYPNPPSGATLALYQQLEAFLASRLGL